MSNPTTPFSWQMPTATDLVTDLPADFEVFGQAVATSMADLLGGTSGQVLAKNSNTDMDFVWVAQDDSNAIQNTIVDAKGDLIAASANDTPARLAVGANDLLLTAASGEATGLKYTGGWTTWTPTFTNFTLGNGTLTARYQKIGKTVNYYLEVTLGSTSSVTGTIIFTYPITPSSARQAGQGNATMGDSGVQGYIGAIGGWSATQGFLVALTTSGSYAGEAQTSATVPFTWTTNDFFFLSGTFEVA
jgi:hypothetical protein